MELGQARQVAFGLRHDQRHDHTGDTTLATQVLDFQQLEVGVAFHCCLVVQWVLWHLLFVHERFVAHDVPHVVRHRVEAWANTFDHGVALHVAEVTLVGWVHLHVDDVADMRGEDDVRAGLTDDSRQLVEQLGLGLTAGHGIGVVLAVTDLVLVVHVLHFFDLELREAVDQKRGRHVGLTLLAVLVQERCSVGVLLRIFGLVVDHVTEELHQHVASVTRQVGESEEIVFFPVDALEFVVGRSDSLEAHDR
ncbi:hypothetical protein D3C80_897270 [compost metagenome]